MLGWSFNRLASQCMIELIQYCYNCTLIINCSPPLQQRSCVEALGCGLALELGTKLTPVCWPCPWTGPVQAVAGTEGPTAPSLLPHWLTDWLTLCGYHAHNLSAWSAATAHLTWCFTLQSDDKPAQYQPLSYTITSIWCLLNRTFTCLTYASFSRAKLHSVHPLCLLSTGCNLL